MPTRPAAPPNLGLSITNPLILYRALVATKKIKPDPAQHRLALQLQKLYFRLKDYAPEVEYRYRLEKIGRGVVRTGPSRAAAAPGQEEYVTQQSGRQSRHGRNRHGLTEAKANEGGGGSGVFSSLLSFNAFPSASTLALTRTTPLHNSALCIDSPLGMLLYGEVGRGKSMLLDLLYDSLPSRKKRRWHFNTFMLDIFRRIEVARMERLEETFASSSARRRRSLFGGPAVSEHEHVILSLAKDTISDSPILFLDEFQMPDRASSKLINGFFTAFFHLGGVLVASSNRMPEELSKAAGIEFGEMQRRNGSAAGGFWGMGWGLSRASEGEKAAKTDFGLFLEVLRTRCEVWEMEGEKDWRREGDDDDNNAEMDSQPELADEALMDDSASAAVRKTSIPATTSALAETSTLLSSDTPAHYHINIPSSPSMASFDEDLKILNPSGTWQSTTLTVYARKLHLPQTFNGVLKSSFRNLCATYLGPADFVSLCSTFHTLILTDVPVLSLTQKNEARRFITLLDALYEAKCRLLIEADAPPDKLFFPETRIRSAKSGATGTDSSAVVGNDNLLEESDDSITSESFSEMYQDSTAPFRPNITSYTDQNIQASIPTNRPSFTASPSNPNLRTVLADEDADFGPTYGNGRGYGISDSSTIPFEAGGVSQGPDFTSTSALTGEDERFAYKRARSRLWEMCGRKWWSERTPVNITTTPEGEGDNVPPEWWRPVLRDARPWEAPVEEDSWSQPSASPSSQPEYPSTPSSHADAPAARDSKLDSMFKHNASPFRRSPDPPPKFGWQHAWGMMRWGKKAGEWGKGVDGSRAKG